MQIDDQLTGVTT